VTSFTWVYIFAPFLGGFTAGLIDLFHGKIHWWLAVDPVVKKSRTTVVEDNDSFGTDISDPDL
jgi:hypothetical protein